MNNIKKGFTFAELMISLVVIAVITAILYPTISELAPNNNKHLFKSAYKTIEMVISDIANSSTAFPTDANTMCKEFEKRLNLSTASNESCQTDKGTNTSLLINSFQTTNGMRWYFTVDNSKVKIFIDVNASNNKSLSNTTDNTISPWSAPSTNPPDEYTNANKNQFGSFIGTNNTTLQDTFFVTVDSQGKIVAIDSIGRQHLLDLSDN